VDAESKAEGRADPERVEGLPEGRRVLFTTQ